MIWTFFHLVFTKSATVTQLHVAPWYCGVVLITTAQLHSTKPELRFFVGSNPARNISEIRDGEDLW